MELKAAYADAKRKTANEGAFNPSNSAKQQMTQAMENYLELHRHAIVRLALLRNRGVAFRLMVAHALVPTGNWNVKPDLQRARSKEIRANVSASRAQDQFNTERDAIEALLGKSVVGGTVQVFARLLTLVDEDVMRIAAFIMADTLAVGSAAVEAAGQRLKPRAAELWQSDDLFFELIHDRTSLNAMLAELSGQSVARSNADETAKVQKKIIRDCLAGENWRTKVEGWLPGWMQFPFKPYGEDTSRIATAAEEAAKILPTT